MYTRIQINWFHLLVVAPLLFYVGFARNFRPLWLNTVLMALGVLIIVYHAYRLQMRGMNLINLLHIFFVGPLLFYIGWSGNRTPNNVFPLVTIIATAVVLYHGGRVAGLIP